MEDSSISSSRTFKRVILNGPPASGKTTQCRLLKEYFSIYLIEPGALVRFEVLQESKEGKAAKNFQYSGKRLPPRDLARIIRKSIVEQKIDSWLFYRGPISVEEAQTFDHEGLLPDLYIVLNVGQEELLRRIRDGRKSFPIENSQSQLNIVRTHRLSDQEQLFLERFHRYELRLGSVLRYYQQEERHFPLVTVKTVDANRSVNEVFQTLCSLIEGV